ncbi:MAG: SRPBCC family protein [Nocardioidaceae bacterium]|nr:SRPBCC family protein [Nocardioidaceae bacterium]
MDLTHQFTVPASIEETWAAFNDLERVAPCFPGATLTSVEGDDFTGACKVKLGPISLQYTGTGRFVQRDEAAHRAVIEAKGKDKRGNGTAAATVTAQLSEAADGTLVEVSTDLAITGKPAQFGRGVMQDVSNKLLGQFVECLRTKFGEPEPEPVPEPVSGTQPADPASTAGTPTTVAAVTTAGAGAGGAPRPEHVATSRTRSEPEAELNLFTTVGPVLLKRYAPAALGVLAAIWLVRKLTGR